MNTSRPPGRSTRRISRTAATGSATVHSTIVDTTTSNDASSNGSASAGAATAGARRRSLREHRRVGLGEDEVHAVGVVREVQPRPGADLEHAPAHVRQQRPPVRGHPAPLAEGQERVIEQRAHARPQAVDRHPPVLRGDGSAPTSPESAIRRRRWPGSSGPSLTRGPAAAADRRRGRPSSGRPCGAGAASTAGAARCAARASHRRAAASRPAERTRRRPRGRRGGSMRPRSWSSSVVGAGQRRPPQTPSERRDPRARCPAARAAAAPSRLPLPAIRYAVTSCVAGLTAYSVLPTIARSFGRGASAVRPSAFSARSEPSRWIAKPEMLPVALPV